MYISAISIHSFRGIPHDLKLDLTSDATGTPQSLLLFGENGTGKSSIVDAIEFALQARIRGSQSRGSLANSARSFASSNLPKVVVLLSDGSSIERSAFQEEDRVEWSDLSPHPHFRMCPFTVRRSDILLFLNTREVDRQKIFLHMSAPSQQGELKTSHLETVELLKERCLQEKIKRRELSKRLAARVGATNPVPLSSPAFEAFVQEKVYGGLSKDARDNAKRRGIKVSADEQAKALVDEIRHVSNKIHMYTGQIAVLSKPATEEPRVRLWNNFFTNVGERLTEAFRQISPNRFVERIEFVPGKLSDVSLSLRVHLQNGQDCSAESVFSEANLDLISLLVFLSIMKESAERGQAKILVLDDVLQSVDATIRFAIADYILQEFSGWQLIFTTHDRLWQSQLVEICRRHNHPILGKEVSRWHFDEGPTIFMGHRDADASIVEAMKSGDIRSICGQAGLLLEEVCSKLSWTFPIAVTRRKGDKYTLGDLWPGIYKVLKKTPDAELAETIDKRLHLRNLVGAHYNEMAEMLSVHDANVFGEAVIALFKRVRCGHCFRWIEATGNNSNLWECRCGRTKLERV